MEYVIDLLEKEIKSLERSVRDGNMLRSDMKQATQYLKHIKELKRAVKILRAKVRM